MVSTPVPNAILGGGRPRREKGFQSLVLPARKRARTPFMAEIPKPRHALPLIDLEPLAHRVVVQQKRRPDLLAVPAVVQKNNRVRPPRHPVLHKAIPRARISAPRSAADKNPGRIFNHTRIHLPPVLT